MKKTLLSLIALLTLSGLYAQDITDAYRYSSEELTGTARFRAMSGAFGALGGDMSSLNINPAGSAVFLNSFATLTLDFRNSKNDVNFFNGFTSSENDDFNLNQAGGVLVFNSTTQSPWKKFVIGLNYAETNNFEDSFVASGINSNSIDDYFLGYADGVPLELLETRENETITDLYSYLGESEGYGAQQAFLGYQAFVIDPETTDLDNTSYTSAIGAGSFDQDFALVSTGLNGKFTFNFGTQYGDNIYLGANLNAHFLNYDRSTRFREANNNSGSTITNLEFRNNLSTTGDGFSFQLGAIGKVSDMVRLGLSYESPTWYSIYEESTQYIRTNEATVNPNVVNVYPEYTLKTPGKATGSLALIFGNEGLLSFDYSYKDYSNTQFRPKNDPDFQLKNNDISNRLQAVSAFRIGGEYRLDQFSFRGGYRYETSPYKDESTVGELNSFSAGLGYNFGSVKLDLAYTNTQFDENRPLYQVGLTDTANISRDLSSVVLSLSFGL
ncbi:OmpP1/FadL family transporter [Salegentibacter chungangensis]|uniref:OmpP1/FadL family transporter n=1 Tax=Salegentibacter chungangensis TaxID=1335724 RepID=A0ABW3NWI0_9FLAO